LVEKMVVMSDELLVVPLADYSVGSKVELKAMWMADRTAYCLVVQMAAQMVVLKVSKKVAQTVGSSAALMVALMVAQKAVATVVVKVVWMVVQREYR
jgi:hypothetical protein